MATQSSKMICPRCGSEMNHHADKLVQPITTDQAKHVNETLGGLIEQTHCCPSCGGVESRLAE